MLTGSEIIKRVEDGRITITPFDKNRVNPNSYNLTLFKELKIYSSNILDMKKEAQTITKEIPEEGMLLLPGNLYLGRTNEFTACKDLIPCLDGRSSIGRLGINVHATAGFGDIGFEGTWTLEISVIKPVIVYPDVEICQIYYYEPVGDTDIKYSGKYKNQFDIGESRMYQDRF